MDQGSPEAPGAVAAFDFTEVLGALGLLLPILLGVVALILLLSVVDAHRRRNKDKH